jgi:hypothetical protein
MLARSHRTSRHVVVLMAALAGFVLPADAAAGRRLPRLVLSPRSGPIGTRVLVKGSGFRSRVKGIIVFGARRVASFQTTNRGTFAVVFAVRRSDSGQTRVTTRIAAQGEAVHAVSFHVLARGSHSGSGGSRWAPPQHLTWYWQLQGTVNNSEPVAAYDIDGFDNTAAEVSTLHAQGRHAICYIDVGTAENWRPDYSSFPAWVLGNSNGWPGEKWLDIRQLRVLQPIMTARFAMCREKGFDAVDGDNMDGYGNNTGFPLTAQQQLTFNEWVAGEVHSLGMAVFQKNDGEQTSQLQPYFDGALNEQCNQYHECSNFQPYLAAGKPVINAEYSLSRSQFCAADNEAGIMGARYSLQLNGSTFEPCW